MVVVVVVVVVVVGWGARVLDVGWGELGRGTSSEGFRFICRCLPKSDLRTCLIRTSLFGRADLPASSMLTTSLHSPTYCTKLSIESIR